MPRKPAKGQQKRQREALSWAGLRACLTQRGYLEVTLGDLSNPMVGTLGVGGLWNPHDGSAGGVWPAAGKKAGAGCACEREPVVFVVGVDGSGGGSGVDCGRIASSELADDYASPEVGTRATGE